MLKTKDIKKSLIFLLIFSMILSNFGFVFANDFSDITDHWAKNEIELWLEKGIIEGYEDGTFRPNNNITRAEFMTLVNKAFGYTEEAVINYPDVKADAWFSNQVAKAKAAGYISGYPDGSIKPNNHISRQEVAIVITRLLGLDEDAEKASNFSDYNKIPDWSKGYIGAVLTANIMEGYPDGTFNAGNPIKRAEAVVALGKAMGQAPEQVPSSIIYDKAGTYGPVEGVETISKDVIISSDGVILQNLIIKGNLTLDKEIGEGDATLNNVIVERETYVSGGGSNSIYIKNSKLNRIIINKAASAVRVVLEGSKVESIKIDKETKLELGQDTEVKRLVVESTANISVEKGAKVEALDIISENVEIEVEGSIASIVATVEAKVNGKTVKEGTEFKVESGKLTEVKEAIRGSIGGSGGYGNQEVAVSTIRVTPETMTLLAGGATGEIIATISPSNATNKAVNWSSSNPSVVTVTNGVVTPVAKGNAIITARSDNNSSKFATTTVAVSDTVDVSSAAELTSALNASGVTTITLSRDITDSEITINRLVDLNLNNFTLGGNITITTVNDGIMKITGEGTIGGDLTINAPNATIENDASVDGDTNIEAVSYDTFNSTGTHTNGIKMVGPGRINLSGQASLANIQINTNHPITLSGQITGGVTINTAGAQARIDDGASVNNITVADTATGSRIEATATSIITNLISDINIIVAEEEGANVTIDPNSEGKVEVKKVLRVTFDNNSGNTQANPRYMLVSENSPINTLPEPPTKLGYSFDTWNTQADGEGTIFTNSTIVTGNIKVYAIWVITNQYISVNVINDTVILGIDEIFNVRDNLNIDASDITLTFESSDEEIASINLDGQITSKSRGVTTITVVASKPDHIDRVVSFNTAVAPIQLSWDSPSGNKYKGHKETIEINIGLLEHVNSIEDVTIVMVWEKKINESDWQIISASDITLTNDDKAIQMNQGLFQLVEDIIESDTSITAAVTFNNVGEYKLTVYAIKE